MHAALRSRSRTLIESVIRGILPEIRRRFIKLLEFVGAGAVATGFSYPFEAVLLE